MPLARATLLGASGFLVLSDPGVLSDSCKNYYTQQKSHEQSDLEGRKKIVRQRKRRRNKRTRERWREAPQEVRGTILSKETKETRKEKIPWGSEDLARGQVHMTLYPQGSKEEKFWYIRTACDAAPVTDAPSLAPAGNWSLHSHFRAENRRSHSGCSESSMKT